MKASMDPITCHPVLPPASRWKSISTVIILPVLRHLETCPQRLSGGKFRVP